MMVLSEQNTEESKREYERVTISLEKKIKKLSKHYAKKTGQTLSFVIERQLKKYLKECYDFLEEEKAIKKLTIETGKPMDKFSKEVKEMEDIK